MPKQLLIPSVYSSYPRKAHIFGGNVLIWIAFLRCLSVPIADVIFPALNTSAEAALTQDMPTFISQRSFQNARATR